MNTFTHHRMFRRHRRGSVLILVVAVLVMTVLVGTAFLQSARRDRFASGQMNRNNLDDIARASLDLVLAPIEQDVRDGGVILPSGKEPYDSSHGIYNNAGTAHTPAVTVVDPFLASSFPVVKNGKPVWPHISQFTLDYSNYDFTNQRACDVEVVKDDIAINLKSQNEGEGTLADADGDGLIDSRWLEAPISQMQGIKYFLCARVIDASSMLNANIATSVYGSSGYDDDDQAPRCWFPTDLDLGYFINTFPEVASRSDVELQNLLKLRYGDHFENASLVPWKADSGGGTVKAWSRFAYWYQAGVMYRDLNQHTGLGVSTKYQHLSWADEMELRSRGGLNSPEHIVAIDDAMHTLLRDRSASGAAQPSELNYGSSNTTHLPPSFSSDKWLPPAYPLYHFNSNPRVMLTTWNGANIYAYRWGTGGGNVHSQMNLNQQIAGGDMTTAATEIQSILSEEGTFSLPAHLPDEQAAANQYAANLKDYADADNKLTKVGDRYGFEALPAISEVYCQRAYEITTETKNGGPDPVTGEQEWNVTWAAKGVIGFGIEIRNPHPITISLENLHLDIDGNDAGTLDTLAGKTTLEPFGAVVLVKNSDGPSADIETEQVTTAGNVTPQAISTTWPADGSNTDFDPNGTSLLFDIALRATDHNGTPLTFAYCKAKGMKLPDEQRNQTFVTNDENTNPASLNIVGYLQQGKVGDGRGLNALLVDPDSYKAVGAMGLPSAEDNAGNVYTSNLCDLGKQTKGKGTTGPLAEWTKHQFPFVPDEQTNAFVHIGEMLQVSFMGFSETDKKTFREVWEDAGAAGHEDLMFDFETTEMAGTDEQAVPHYVAILNRFTTYGPNSDGQDNDDDGSIDNDEYFVPGRININTVSGDLDSVDGSRANTTPHLLIRCLPIPDLALRQKVVRAILEYRDKPGSRPSDFRKEKGIAYIGELMAIPEVREALTTGSYSGDTRTIPQSGGVIVDRSPADAGDTIADDIEEKVMLFKWLSQVLTTRSDVFIVYLTVRGVDISVAENHEDYGKAVQQRRYIAVVDRSSMAENGGTGKAEIIAFHIQQ